MTLNKRALEYARKVQSYYPGQVYNTPAILEFADWISLKHSSVLDIGCGDGQLLHILQERNSGLRLAGLTVNPDEKARIDPRIDVRIGDMHQLPWCDASFDAVLCRHSLEHSISPLSALFEANRVLKPAGLLYVVVPAPYSEWVIQWPSHFSVLPRALWGKLFQDAGFEILEVRDGKWLASYSMQYEPEMWFRLRKLRECGVVQESESPTSPRATAYPSEGTASEVHKPVIAILHNLVLFDAVRPLLEQLRDRCLVVVPDAEAEGWRAMADDTVRYVGEAGFEVRKAFLPANFSCDIELSPYPYRGWSGYATEPNVCQAKWRVRFLYGLAKEQWNFAIVNNLYYDYALTYGDYDSTVLAAYTTPVCVGSLRAMPPKRVQRTGTAVLLYMPTYGDLSSVERAADSLSALKAQYRLMIKAHHGTTYLEPERLALLRELADEFHDHSTPVAAVLSRADIVLSDSSGAIFDSIAAGVPVAVFQPVVAEGIGGTISLEQQVVQNDLVPHTDDPARIAEIVNRARGMKSSHWTRLRNMLFVATGDAAVSRAAGFIGSLLAHDNPGRQTYRVAKRQLLETVLDGRVLGLALRQTHGAYQALVAQLVTDIKKLESELEPTRRALAEREERLEAIYRSRSWRMTRLFRWIRRKLS